jgi:uncharacterized tellurite resistance protein B-like protein
MDIDFKTKISTLNPRQRAWFATAMVAMVLADGNIDRAEVDFIVKLISLIKDDQMIDRLKKFIQFKTVPPLGPPAEIDRKLGMSMLIDLIRVAVADKNFPQTEKDMVLKVGRSMGFSEDEMDKLILYGFELMNKEQAQAS